MPSGKKLTHDDFISLLMKKNPKAKTFDVISCYESYTTKITCKCKKCNYIWYPVPKQILKSGGCPKCSGNVKLTHEEFLKKFEKQNSHYEIIEILSKYNGVMGKIKCKCIICDTIWDTSAGNLLNSNTGCPVCSGNKTRTHELFLRKFKQKNPYAESISILSTYNGCFEKIKCKCKICQNEWDVVPNSLIQGTGCPHCAKRRIAAENVKYLIQHKTVPMSHSEFVEKFKKSNPYFEQIEMLGEYNHSKVKIKCKCKMCQNEWDALPSSLLGKAGCPKCSHTSTSFMEQFIFHSLKYALPNDNILNRTKRQIGMELDIFDVEKRLAIEIGSWKWHKKTIDRDIMKEKLCKSNGITSYFIYDSFADDKFVYALDNVFVFSFDLGAERNHLTLKKIVKEILKMENLAFEFTNELWDIIEEESYLCAQRISHEEFINKFNENNKNSSSIMILSKYKKATSYMNCICKRCSHSWRVQATELLRGSGCPKCNIKEVGIKRRKKEIIQNWRLNNPNGTKLKCEKETGISRVTVYKWWDEQ